jgi:hypothetical protein
VVEAPDAEGYAMTIKRRLARLEQRCLPRPATHLWWRARTLTAA